MTGGRDGGVEWAPGPRPARARRSNGHRPIHELASYRGPRGDRAGHSDAAREHGRVRRRLRRPVGRRLARRSGDERRFRDRPPQPTGWPGCRTQRGGARHSVRDRDRHVGDRTALQGRSLPATRYRQRKLPEFDRNRGIGRTTRRPSPGAATRRPSTMMRGVRHSSHCRSIPAEEAREPLNAHGDRASPGAGRNLHITPSAPRKGTFNEEVHERHRRTGGRGDTDACRLRRHVGDTRRVRSGGRAHRRTRVRPGHQDHHRRLASSGVGHLGRCRDQHPGDAGVHRQGHRGGRGARRLQGRHRQSGLEIPIPQPPYRFSTG